MATHSKGKPIPKKKTVIPQKKNFWEQGWIPYALLVIVFILYSGVLKNGFVDSWDDELYLAKDPRILHLNFKNLIAIFTGFHGGNYHPITTLVHSIELQMFGLNAKGYHMVSLLFHMLNTFLVYRFIRLLMKRADAAVLIALLFAIHPMHVESVAWFAETKDVLYTCFFLLAMIAYTKYAQSSTPEKKIYLYSLLFFLLSLFSKSMAVTLPLVLLAIDFYLKRPLKKKVLIEKIPFFALALLFGVIAIFSQKAGGAIDANAGAFTILDRILMAGYGVSFYIIKLFIPFGLSAYHPFPLKEGGLLPTIYFVASILPLVVAFIVWRMKAVDAEKQKLKREVIFGLFIFLFTVGPVLQLIPVGMAVVAERYTYFPYIGLFIALMALINYLSDKAKKSGASVQSFVVAGFVILFSVLTWQRVTQWKDLATLFTSVVNQYPDNAMAQYNLGHAWQDKKDLQKSMSSYTEAIRLNPKYVEAYNNRGALYYLADNPEGAVEDFTKAIVLRNDTSAYGSYFNRGIAYNQLKKYAEAEKDFNYLISKDPKMAKAYYLRGHVRLNLGRSDDACADWRKAESLGFQKASESIKQLCE
ncbi:MAG: tetratricopeptide repeat protein [Bacteroidota bacterium]